MSDPAAGCADPGRHRALPGNDVTVLVLTGGRSRRFGSDKLSAPFRGSTVLDHLLGSLTPGWAVVAVGAPRGVAREVTWTAEDPPDGGPLAGVAAGVAVVRTELVAVVAGDMPHAAAALPELVAALGEPGVVDGAVAVDGDGHANPLLAVYRTDAVRAILPRPARDVPAKRLLSLSHATVRVRGSAARDVDTPADLADLEWP